MFQGKPRLIETSLRRKAENILFTLNAASEIQAMNLPGYRLHPLTGDLAGIWSVMSANWRIIFRFENGSA